MAIAKHVHECMQELNLRSHRIIKPAIGPRAMAAPLLDRLRLVGRLLTALKGPGGEAYARASAAQAAAMKGQVLQASLSLEQTTEAVEELGKIPWQCSQHGDEVLAAFSAGLAGADPAGYTSRRKLQDYTAIVNYFTDAQWEFLQGSSVPSQKLAVVLQHAHCLGLRCSSESTIQRLTCLFLISTEGPIAAKAMSHASKLAMTRHVKRELKRIGDTPALAYIVELPSLPSDFASQHPAMYAAAFKSQVPANMKFDWNSFAEVLAGIPCRGSKVAACSSVDAGNFSQVATGFMQQMQQIQQMQLYTYYALTSTGKGAAPKLPTAVQNFLSGSANSLSAGSSQSHVQIQDLRQGQLHELGPFPAQIRREPHELPEQQPKSPPEPQTRQPPERQQLPPPEPQSQQPPEQKEPEQKEPEQKKPEQQPPGEPTKSAPEAKKPRLSVTDSISLIASKLGERDSDKAAAKAKEKAKGKDKEKAKEKTKPKAKAAGTTKPKARAASASNGGTSLTGTWKPSFDIVESRKHVQCRTGLKGPGQYRAISFTFAGSKEKAIAMATKWVKEQEQKGRP